MRRGRSAEDDAADPGGDSFLDVVTNIVGIMIVLVMVTGVRVGKFATAQVKFDAVTEEAERSALSALASEREVAELDARVRAVRASIELRKQERLELASAAAAARAVLDESEKELSAAEQSALRLAADEEALQAERTSLAAKLATEIEPEEEVVEVSSLPTPLSQEVRGSELHFHLQGGRVAYVPLDALVEQFKLRATTQAREQTSSDQIVDEVGPIDGFRMQYRLVRRGLTSAFGVSAGSVVQLAKWELTPESATLGEPIDVALADGSQFRARLAKVSPESVVATVWVYPDSFAEFRRLKQELFSLGFSTAARPLPDGVRIAGSPDGSRSAAQ